jgi:acyl carrier protein
MESLRKQVRDFIATNFYLPDPAALSDDASLIDIGVIDSTGVLEVIGFLETTFEITVEEAEMVPENLDSISRIVAFLGRKRPQALAASG